MKGSTKELKELTKDDIEEKIDSIDQEFNNSVKRPRGVSLKKRAITPRRKSKQEQLEKEINETVKKSILSKQTLKPLDIRNIMAKSVIIKTDEEKLKKMRKCPFIEPIEIY